MALSAGPADSPRPTNDRLPRYLAIRANTSEGPQSTLSGHPAAVMLTDIETSGARIRLRHAGSGPPLLLLHGNPLTHVSWHKVAPRLAERFHVVAADLRGCRHCRGKAGRIVRGPARATTPLRPCGDPRLGGAVTSHGRGYSSACRPTSGRTEIGAVSGVGASGR